MIINQALDLSTDQKKLLTNVKQKFIRKTILKEEISNYEEQGYVVSSKQKSKAIVKKLKPEIELGYYEFVQLFCEMGFKIIPNLPHSFNDETKDISDFSFIAEDNECILICYYLYSDTKKEISSFEHVLENIKANYGELLKELKKIFTGNKKFKVIICTKNYALSKSDISFIDEQKYFYIDDDRLEYFINLNKHLGNASKYQLLGNLFSGQKIANLDEVIPAIQGKMGGLTYYSFSIEPEKLLKIGYILHRTDANRNDMPTYQRLIKKSRLKQIETFINNGGFFPNSVIISIDTNKKGLTFSLSSLQDEASISKIGLLKLPQRYKSVYIIDGQHRLYGYANTQYKETNTIPVVAFLDLAKNDQVKLFMEINENQKSVSKNLRTTLNADLLWDSENPTERNTALFSRIAQELGENTDSPLFDRVIIGENNKTDKCCITLDTIRDALDKSGLFNKYKGTEIERLGICDLNNNDKNFDNVFTLLVKAFEYIQQKNVSDWGKTEDINKWVFNISIYGLIRIISDITNIILNTTHYKKNEINSHFEDFKPYLDAIIQGVNNFTEEQRNDLKTTYGGKGRSKYWRTLQGLILIKFPSLVFEGYEKWLKDTSKMFNKEAFSMIGDIETYLKEDFKKSLQDKYGEDWQILGVPYQVMKDAQELALKKRYEEPTKKYQDWDCLHLCDYRKIAVYKSNWTDLFEKKYSDPELKSGNKDKKTEWMEKMNRIRNQNDHTYSVSEEEFNFIKKIHNWLIK